ncbi:hypothetical protein FHS89_000213 [Rubricella aquisinus]|uniref:Uncharacterized protein n=1 Tax=Rubricella aquisinus TaxID=2028108 RepID=A0A840WWZ7_9RHOB|nr:hypothetical protein [Rubricella aquisinus]MBB5514215.1 hypothetical protein [Rubricella aquisinus]
MRTVLLLASSLIVAGCSGDFDRADAAGDFEALLLGFSPNQISACAGAPRATRALGADEIWVYEYRAFERGYYDKDYIGVTELVFTDGEVSAVVYGSNHTTDGIGLPLAESALRNFNAPIFARC